MEGEEAVALNRTIVGWKRGTAPPAELLAQL